VLLVQLGFHIEEIEKEVLHESRASEFSHSLDPEVPSLTCIAPRALGIRKQAFCPVEFLSHGHDGLAADRGVGTSCPREKLLHFRSARG